MELAAAGKRSLSLAQDAPKCERFGDKIMRYFMICERRGASESLNTDISACFTQPQACPATKAA
jgi:hypothetical protein